MLLDLDVVVDVNLDGLEVRHLIGLRRQGQQGRRVECSEGACTAARQLLERVLIELREQRRDRLVHFVYARKPLMAQARHDPAFDDLDRRLRFRLLVSQQLSVMRNNA